MIVRIQILDRHEQEVIHWDMNLNGDDSFAVNDINFVERGVMLHSFNFRANMTNLHDPLESDEEIQEGEDL